MLSNVKLPLVLLLTALLAACSSAPPPDAPKSPDAAAAPDGSSAPAARGVEECVWPPGTPAGAPPACPPGCFWDEKDTTCKPDRGVIVPQRPN